MWFRCQPVSMGELESVSSPIVNKIIVDATPERIFEVFEDAASWPEWVGSINKVEWTSSRPFRRGTTRIVTLQGVKADETFITWDHGRRMTFYFTATSIPFAKRFCEDYKLEAIGNGHSEIRHTVIFEPNFLTALISPLLKSSMKKMFKKALQDLSVYAPRYEGDQQYHERTLIKLVLEEQIGVNLRELK